MIEHEAIPLEVSATVFSKRIREGIRPEDAWQRRCMSYKTNLPPVTPKMWGWNTEIRMFVAPDGDVYPSRSAMAKAYGINPSVVSRRLAYGCSLDEALSKGKKESYNHRVKHESFGYNDQLNGFTLDGKKVYETYTQMCKDNGISCIAWRIVCAHQLDKIWCLQHKDLPFQKINLPGKENPVSLLTACQKALENQIIGVETILYHALKNEIPSLQVAFDQVLDSKKN